MATRSTRICRDDALVRVYPLDEIVVEKIAPSATAHETSPVIYTMSGTSRVKVTLTSAASRLKQRPSCSFADERSPRLARSFATRSCVSPGSGVPVSPRRWCCYPNSTACSALCSAAFVRLDYLIEASEILCDGMAEDSIKSMKGRRVGRASGELLLYYMLGSDPALWPAGERREGGLITHDKGYYHSYLEGVLMPNYPTLIPKTSTPTPETLPGSR